MYRSAVSQGDNRQLGLFSPYFQREDTRIRCDWAELRTQLLQQWTNIPVEELDRAGPDRRRIARLVARIYHIATDMVENYLLNVERTLPLTGVH